MKFEFEFDWKKLGIGILYHHKNEFFDSTLGIIFGPIAILISKDSK